MILLFYVCKCVSESIFPIRKLGIKSDIQIIQCPVLLIFLENKDISHW